MIGNQIANLLIQFFLSIYHSCCKSEKHHEEQWEKDKDLIEFTSSTLMYEYLDIGKSF